MAVRIVGAGMAGLLAGAMLRGQARIYEAAPSLPHNHHALLRFRSDEIAHHLNIPFEAVSVIKIVKPWRNKVADALSYSIKSNGTVSLRSSVTAEGKIDKRFIAPPDFIQQLEQHQSCPITFGAEIGSVLWFKESMRHGEPVISTMPMLNLMKLLGYKDIPEFSHRSGLVAVAELGITSSACATIYYPEENCPIIRATLTKTLLQVELVEGYDRNNLAWPLECVMKTVISDLGIGKIVPDYEIELKKQKYAKISPIPERDRRRFMIWATDNYGVYSVGRFATWKPGLLLDDVFSDIVKVQAMIRNSSNYDGRLK